MDYPETGGYWLIIYNKKKIVIDFVVLLRIIFYLNIY